MARAAFFASGSGTNFLAAAEALESHPKHQAVCLICNRKSAKAFDRARALGIPAFHVDYRGKTRKEAEDEILTILEPFKPDLLVLAGFMKLITGHLLSAYRERIINIHPALLPKFPGAHGIEESYASGDSELGITIHRVDEGMDTGPIIRQASFRRRGTESLEEIEEKIHALEHKTYPETIIRLLDGVKTPSLNQEVTL